MKNTQTIKMKIRFTEIRLIAYLIALYCAFIPLENVLVSSLGGSVNRYLGIIVMGVTILYQAQNHKTTMFIGKFGWVALLFCLMIVSSVWGAYDLVTGYYSVIINMFLFTFIVIQQRLRESEYNFILLCIVLSTVVTAAVMVFGSEYTSVNEISGGRMTIKIGELVVDNNNLAVSFGIAALCAFYFLFKRTNKFLKIISGILFGFLVFSILQTGSRGGLMALFVAIVFFLIAHNRGISIKMILVAVIVFLLMLFFVERLLPAELAERFTVDSVVESGGTGRTDIWTDAFLIFKDSSFLRQLFGYGFGTFPNMMKEECNFYIAAHNDFVQILLELGMLGVALHISMWIKLFKMVIKKNNALLVGLLVIILVGSLSMEMFVKKMLWLVIYLAFICPDESQLIASNNKYLIKHNN